MFIFTSTSKNVCFGCQAPERKDVNAIYSAGMAPITTVPEELTILNIFLLTVTFSGRGRPSQGGAGGTGICFGKMDWNLQPFPKASITNHLQQGQPPARLLPSWLPVLGPLGATGLHFAGAHPPSPPYQLWHWPTAHAKHHQEPALQKQQHKTWWNIGGKKHKQLPKLAAAQPPLPLPCPTLQDSGGINTNIVSWAWGRSVGHHLIKKQIICLKSAIKNLKERCSTSPQQSWEHPSRTLQFPWKKCKCQNRSSSVEFWSLFALYSTAKSLYSFVNFIKRCLSHMYPFRQGKEGKGKHFAADIRNVGRDRQLKDTSAKWLRNIKNLHSCLQILWNLASLTASSILYWQQQSDKNHLRSKSRRKKKSLIHSHTNPYRLQKGNCFRACFNSNILTSLFVFPEACQAFFPSPSQNLFDIICVRWAHTVPVTFTYGQPVTPMTPQRGAGSAHWAVINIKVTLLFLLWLELLCPRGTGCPRKLSARARHKPQPLCSTPGLT